MIGTCNIKRASRRLLHTAKTSLVAALLLGAFLSSSEPTFAQEKRQRELSPAPAGSNSDEPITLRQAVQIALEKNPMRKAALADRKVATAGVKQAQAMLLPHIDFSEIATRGNDPVYVFGTRLRQQRFTAGDFALNQVNRPTPIGNFACCSLLPVMWSVGAGGDVMKRIAAPMIGGILTSFVMELVIYPPIFGILEMEF